MIDSIFWKIENRFHWNSNLIVVWKNMLRLKYLCTNEKLKFPIGKCDFDCIKMLKKNLVFWIQYHFKNNKNSEIISCEIIKWFQILNQTKLKIRFRYGTGYGIITSSFTKHYKHIHTLQLHNMTTATTYNILAFEQIITDTTFCHAQIQFDLSTEQNEFTEK